jgi:hypothetical protein
MWQSSLLKQLIKKCLPVMGSEAVETTQNTHTTNTAAKLNALQYHDSTTDENRLELVTTPSMGLCLVTEVWLQSFFKYQMVWLA